MILMKTYKHNSWDDSMRFSPLPDKHGNTYGWQGYGDNRLRILGVRTSLYEAIDWDMYTPIKRNQ